MEILPSSFDPSKPQTLIVTAQALPAQRCGPEPRDRVRSRSLLYVCRKINDEAGCIYPEYTRFLFENMTAFEHFLKKVCPSIKDDISSVYISHFADKPPNFTNHPLQNCNYNCHVIFSLLTACPKLRLLEFRHRFDYHLLKRTYVLRDLRGLQYVRLGDVEYSATASDPKPPFDFPLHSSYRKHFYTMILKMCRTITLHKGIEQRQSVPKSAEPRVPFTHTKFGQLPLQVRQKIYEKVLIISNDYKYLENAQCQYPLRGMEVEFNFNNPRIQYNFERLNILATSRQIHEEAYGMFYRDNHLVFNNFTQDLHGFLSSIGRIRRQEITSIECIGFDPLDPIRTYLSQVWPISAHSGGLGGLRHLTPRLHTACSWCFHIFLAMFAPIGTSPALRAGSTSSSYICVFHLVFL